MTVSFPDLSHHNGPIYVGSCQAVIAKATQGTEFVDALYKYFREQARANARLFAAYHWLDTTPAAAQAMHCFGVVGSGTPLMIDDEQNIINVDHTLEFVQTYRALGGLVTLEYAPRWVWARSGQPDLRPLERAGLSLVSSNYSEPYSDDGVGWQPYGGVTPVAWQFTNKQPLGGQLVDYNGFRGSLDELRTVFFGGDVALSEDDLTRIADRVWGRVISSGALAYSDTAAEWVKKILLGVRDAHAPLTDAQLGAVADQVAGKLRTLQFSAP